MAGSLWVRLTTPCCSKKIKYTNNTPIKIKYTNNIRERGVIAMHVLKETIKRKVARTKTHRSIKEGTVWEVT